MSKKQTYYRVYNILKTRAQYKILLGERSNGKSYAVKEYCLKEALKGNEFGYLRRWKTDVRASDVLAYFADMNIKKLTGGMYEGVDVYRGNIYFCNYDDDGKVVRGNVAGHVFYLSVPEHFKSQAYPYITNIIFEEFVTSGMYLDDEPNQLQHLISTIARRREISVWMIGNTISRVCPYFTEWGLQGIPKQEQGTIDEYIFHTDQINEDGSQVIVKIAVENCANSGSNSKMFFGAVSKQITSGTWEIREYPHLPRPYEEYSMLYELLFEDMGFSFILQLLVNKDGGLIVYVYPFTKKRRMKRIITSTFSDNPLTSTRFFDNIKVEKQMRNCLLNGKVCFSDNLTGSDFNQILENRKGVL